MFHTSRRAAAQDIVRNVCLALAFATVFLITIGAIQ